MTLAHHLQRRQDVPPPFQQPSSSSETPSPPTSPYLLPTTSSYSYFNNKALANNKFASSPPQPPPALDLNYSFSSNDCYYIDSRQSTPSDHFSLGVADTQWMQNAASQYPQLRLQQSAVNGLPPATTPPPMVEGLSQQSWNTYSDNAYLAPSPQRQYNPSLSYRTHKRLPSDSSITSGGPDSPYTQTSTYPRIVDSDAQSIHSAHLEGWENSTSNFNQYSKPAFAQPSNSDLFYNPAFQNFNPVSNDAISMISTQTAMGQVMNQQRGSNVNGAQNTSRRMFGGGADPSSEIRTNTPQLDRTMSDVYQDELYNPALAQPVPSSQPRQQGQGDTVSPHKSTFSDLLQVANTGHLTARSASPAVNISRQRSPFRESSQFAVEGAYSSPSSPAGATRLTSAAQLRQQQKNEADAHAFAQHHPPSRPEYLNPPKTISPKEAHLDFVDNIEEDSGMPLFPQVKREPRFSSHNSIRGLHTGNTDEIVNNDRNYSSMATGNRESSSSSAPQTSVSGFPSMPSSTPAVPQQYPFISESRRQSSSMRSGSDQVPEFPASLTSMESTKSETGPPEKVKIIPDAELSLPSSQEAPVSRPANTTASSGTYTCTTPDCHARFDTAAKLQKHRREAHRASSQYASTPTTPTSATNNAQAASNSTSRNNAVDHKCTKPNPQTGKPCNTVFSRSYDLTRHDDTIHNNKKQKVRCHLCTEEKTFSRSDALTRHMRVVHPDVDFPGKSRRGRNEGVDVVRQRIETGRGGR